jgi:hypothetical protein
MSKQLREANRIAQIALEFVRLDPDDEDRQAELEQATDAQFVAWAKHAASLIYWPHDLNTGEGGT